jgi:hypothetical protein
MVGPTPRRNPDQDIPTKTGEQMGAPEPAGPPPQPKRERNTPLPDEETYERSGGDKRSEERPPVERE